MDNHNLAHGWTLLSVDYYGNVFSALSLSNCGGNIFVMAMVIKVAMMKEFRKFSL